MSVGPNFFNYRKLLTTPLKRSSLITDLADVCNEVLGKEVEERRRRLEHSRDSVRYRKGEIVSWFDYLPEKGNLAFDKDTNEVVDIPVGSSIPKARILQVVSNIGVYGEEASVDYLRVEFDLSDGRTVQWNMPVNAPQERSLLISNAYMSGFDFYSTTLSDEDYQRLYEFLNMFWPENGIDDNFIKFIGFIKNLKLELSPLWSENNDTDKITILEEINESRIKVTEGGPWYLTSHVAINYDLKQQSNLYPLNFDEIERLFYLFAPIMLVLERIVGHLDVFIEYGQASVPIADVVNYGISAPDLNAYFDHYRLVVPSTDIVNYGIYRDVNYEDDLDGVLIIPVNVTFDIDLYIPMQRVAFSLKVTEIESFVTRKFSLLVRSGQNTLITATLDNGLLYLNGDKIIVYIPETDLNIRDYQNLTYSLRYLPENTTVFREIVKGRLVPSEQAHDGVNLELLISDYLVAFSITPTDSSYDVELFEYSLSVLNETGETLIIANRDNNLLYTLNGSIVIYIDKANLDASAQKGLNYQLYARDLHTSNEYSLIAYGPITQIVQPLSDNFIEQQQFLFLL